MCGRFTRTYTWKEVHDFLDLRLPAGVGPQLGLSYNVAPTQDSAIARAGAEGRAELAIARWGLVPSWAESDAIGNRMINARSEGAAAKPAFRAAFKSRRCLVPVSGFLEWEKHPGRKAKHPWRFRPADGPIMCLAGLWERWEKSGEPLDTFTILTRDADEPVRAVHDRMPVILPREDFARWLDPEASREALEALLASPPRQPLEVEAVSQQFNNPRYQGP